MAPDTAPAGRAIAGAADGRLVVSAFQPLDARAIRMLTSCGVKPAPDGTVCLRQNNWEYTLDASAGMGQAYAAHDGETYLSYWEFGIGVSADGETLPDWRRYMATNSLRQKGPHSSM